MRVIQTHGRIELRNAPTLLWGLGLWLIAGGALCLGMVAFRADGLALWERAVGALIGAGVLAGGLYHMTTSPATVLAFDTVRRRVRYERRAPLRRREVIDVPADEFLGTEIVVSHDSDGDPWLELTAQFAGRAPVPLDSASGGARQYLQDTAAAISAASRRVLPASHGS